MSNNNSASAGVGGITCSGLLGIAFVVLKLCGVIDWSWWWVTSPFWIPLAIVAVVFVCAMVLVGIGRALL